MMQRYDGFSPWMNSPIGLPLLGGFFFLVIIWTLAWKGMALWRAARKGETAWFVALLVINTLGILEIIYLYVFSTPEMKGEEKPTTSETQ